MHIIRIIFSAIATLAGGAFPFILNWVIPALDIVNRIVQYTEENDRFTNWTKLDERARAFFKMAFHAIRTMFPDFKYVDNSEVIPKFLEWLNAQPEAVRNATLLKLGSLIVRELVSDEKKGRTLSEAQADFLVQLAYVSRKHSLSLQ